MESMNESRSIRVIIADDQKLVRAGFAMVIGSQPDMEVVGRRPTAPKPWRWRNPCIPTWC